jgi:hypothetical protein
MIDVRRNLIDNLNANKENLLINQLTPPSSTNKAYTINLNQYPQKRNQNEIEGKKNNKPYKF